MRLPELALLYGLVGVGCSVALLVVRRSAARGASLLLDAALLAPLWPLYGPFMLLRAMPAEEAPRRGGPEPSGLTTLLPGADATGALEARLALAGERIAEIDRLLAEPDFDESVAEERQRQLEDRGDDRAAATARGRVASIRRLRTLRARFEGELAEIREILAQLRVQAEVVRLAGDRDASSSEELLDELRLRLETLDDMLACTTPDEV